MIFEIISHFFWIFYLYKINCAHGDVVQLGNDSGAVIKNYLYDAFGSEKNADESDTNPFRYSGEYYDSSSGTYYLRARYYQPETGRFITEDLARYVINEMHNGQLVVDHLSHNLYIYCGNDPVVFIDPSGLAQVALRKTAEAAGATVSWDQKTKTATISLNGKSMSFYVGDNNQTIIKSNNTMYVEELKGLNIFLYGINGVARVQGNNMATAFYTQIEKPNTKQGATVVSAEVGIAKVNMDYKYGALNITGVTADAKAGIGADYVGVTAGARAAGGEAIGKIPIPFTGGKKIVVGAGGEILAIGAKGYVENGKLRLGASFGVGAYAIVGIE